MGEIRFITAIKKGCKSLIIRKIIANLQSNILVMIKVEKNNQKINPFGGINFLIDKEKVISSNKNTYEINKHDKINQLNISILMTLKTLKSNNYYDYDFDNEVLHQGEQVRKLDQRIIKT